MPKVSQERGKKSSAIWHGACTFRIESNPGGVMIGVSEKVAGANPALAGFLSGAGLASAIFAAADGWHKGLAVFAPDEEACAAPYDLILAFGADTPSFTRATMTAPARLAFGAADLAFGNALAAELLRPAGRPACGEAESAATLDFAARIAASDASVLLLGETGTGKEGLARYIHLRSPRHKGPFTAVNCAALPETMLEAILFGHRKGAFTGAGADGEGLFRAADGGTLLLDEIAEIPLALQAKLLRALQEREILPVGAVRPEPVDLRVVASANRDLAAEVAAGRFRADLYWRLNVMPVTLKPLRARRLHPRHRRRHAAAPLPADHALRLPDPRSARPADRPLLARQLPRARERPAARDPAARRRADRGGRPGHRRHPAPAATVAEAPAIVPLDEAARAAETHVIRAALDEVGGHRVRAAQRLGSANAPSVTGSPKCAPSPPRRLDDVNRCKSADGNAKRHPRTEQRPAARRRARRHRHRARSAARRAPSPVASAMRCRPPCARSTTCQARASAMTEAYERGETTDIAAVMLSRQQASIGFEATLQVRNRLLTAYRDIMSMPV